MDKDIIYSLVSKIGVMKPSHIKEDNLKHQMRLADMLKSPDYGAEDKIDGCHYTMISGLFFSTEKVEKTDNFPHLRDFFISLNMPNLLIDGEINYPGRTSQYCTHVTGSDPSTAATFQQSNDGPIHYTMFDILRTPKGTWLLKEPYHARRRILQHFYDTFIKNTPIAQFIHLTQLEVDNKQEFLDNILSQGLEGIILKKLDSYYHMGKKPMWQWTKIKQKDETDLIITGFEAPTKEYSGTDFDNWPYWRDENGVMLPVSKPFYNNWIGAIVLSAYVNGVLTRICTSSGMDEVTRKDMSDNGDNYLGKVARIGYMERTDAGNPRHPKFIDMHPGKSPEACIWELN